MASVDALDFIPIVLAIVVLVMAPLSLKYVRRKSDIAMKVIMMIGSILLIVAQTSWWHSAVVEKDLIGTWFANKTWLVFDTLTMIVFILNSYPRSKNGQTSS